jgi:hypothetical protein
VPHKCTSVAPLNAFSWLNVATPTRRFTKLSNRFRAPAGELSGLLRMCLTDIVLSVASLTFLDFTPMSLV